MNTETTRVAATSKAVSDLTATRDGLAFRERVAQKEYYAVIDKRNRAHTAYQKRDAVLSARQDAAYRAYMNAINAVRDLEVA